MEGETPGEVFIKQFFNPFYSNREWGKEIV